MPITPSLPNGNGGYQFGDGNLNEPDLVIQQAPVALTAAATLTATQLAIIGLFTYTGAAAAVTLPTAADMDTLVSSARPNHSFRFSLINIGGTNAATVTAGTGWTIVGTAAVAANTSSTWIARKTGTATWTAYRV